MRNANVSSEERFIIKLLIIKTVVGVVSRFSPHRGSLSDSVSDIELRVFSAIWTYRPRNSRIVVIEHDRAGHYPPASFMCVCSYILHFL